MFRPAATNGCVLKLPLVLTAIAIAVGIAACDRPADKSASAKPELTPQMLEILAGRAIYTLPYHRLLAYSRNPAEDWYLRRFEPLARAELERHGLSVERYFDVRPALES